MSKRESPHGPPAYKELKRRCDFCDKEFRLGDIIAASSLRFDCGGRPYTFIFCYHGEDNFPRCLCLWRTKYEVQFTDFVVMVYHGKKRGFGNPDHDPVLA